jgi:hypothetical protein
MSLTIAECHLAPVMELRARELELAFPGLITFTSGRRTLHEQAQAMAVNHVQDPQSYLVRQYIHASDFLHALSGLDHYSVDEITEAIYAILVARPFLVSSPHLDGNAVDLRPMELPTGQPTIHGGEVIEWIRARPETTDFRTREGKLRRWHWACVPAVET